MKATTFVSLASVSFAGALTSLTFAQPLDTGQRPGGRFVAFLGGDEEAPQVETEGRGLAVFNTTRRGEGLLYSLLSAGLDEITQAHIHMGPPGANGPVVAFLLDAFADPINQDGPLSSGMLTAGDLIGPLGGEPLSALLEQMKAGNAYVNVHTLTNPPGEIRGQIEAVGGRMGPGPSPSPLARPRTLVDCQVFGGVVTPATFDPEHDPFDELYVMPDSPGFLDGVPLISESKPGDRDYNGGRWHLNVLREGVDPDIYADACSIEDLLSEDFEPTDQYFECPLLPRRDRGRAPARSRRE